MVSAALRFALYIAVFSEFTTFLLVPSLIALALPSGSTSAGHFSAQISNFMTRHYLRPFKAHPFEPDIRYHLTLRLATRTALVIAIKNLAMQYVPRRRQPWQAGSTPATAMYVRPTFLLSSTVTCPRIILFFHCSAL